MSAPRKYDQEFWDRAVRMYRDRFAEGNDSKLGARRHVGSLLDLNPATLRNWGRMPSAPPAFEARQRGGRRSLSRFVR
jgi:hypothetical protein